MIRMFLVERKSWVIFFAACQLMLLFIAWLDPQIALSSVLYIVFLETIAFLLFLFFRARKEVKFYQSLSEWDGDLDTSEIPAPEPLLNRSCIRLYKRRRNIYGRKLTGTRPRCRKNRMN